MDLDDRHILCPLRERPPGRMERASRLIEDESSRPELGDLHAASGEGPCFARAYRATRAQDTAQGSGPDDGSGSRAQTKAGPDDGLAACELPRQRHLLLGRV